jgi:hypothetical protein
MAEDSRSQFRAASDLYEVQPGAKQQVDHIITKARGGTDDPSNLQALCREGHSRKKAMIDDRWGIYLQTCRVGFGSFQLLQRMTSWPSTEIEIE